MVKRIEDLMKCLEITGKDNEIANSVANFIYDNDPESADAIILLLQGFSSDDVFEIFEENEVDVDIDDLFDEYDITYDDMTEEDGFLPLLEYIRFANEEDYEEFYDDFKSMISAKGVNLDISSLTEELFNDSEEKFLIKLNELLNTVGYNLVIFNNIGEDLLSFSFIKLENKKIFENCINEIFKDCCNVLDMYRIF